MHSKACMPVAAAVILPNIGGLLGGYITKNNIKPWYQTLKKPEWIPPNWVFGPVWTGIYCSIGYSSYLVWRDGGGFKGAAMPLGLYGANLALNWAWTPLFFGAHKMKWALYDIVLLWGETIAMGIAFFHVNRTAAWLIAPYVAWNSFAGVLNYVMYRDNEYAVEAAEDRDK